MGAETGRVIALGQRATVRLAEAAPVSGGLAFDLIELEGVHVPHGVRVWRRGQLTRLVA